LDWLARNQDNVPTRGLHYKNPTQYVDLVQSVPHHVDLVQITQYVDLVHITQYVDLVQIRLSMLI
jgi:hypothetical protein